MAAVIDITNDEQRAVVRRLFRESGNVNVKTASVRKTKNRIQIKLVRFQV